MHMAHRFTLRADGIIEVDPDSLPGFFGVALNDAVTSRAPRGARNPGLSTYWIDLTEVAAQDAFRQRSDGQIAAGNVWSLQLRGDQVLTRYDFEPAGASAVSMPLDDLLAVLAAWRDAVIASGGVSGGDAALVDHASPGDIAEH